MRRPPLILWLFCFVVACSTDECSCNGWETRSYPASRLDKTVPSAGQVRLTPTGIDYVDSQIPYLLDQFLDDGLNFCIPRETSGNPSICVDSTCSNGQAGCQVGLVLESRDIRPVPSNRLEIDLTISINQRLNFDYGTFLGTVNCYVQVFKRGASASTRGNIIGKVPITLGIDGASPTKELTINIGTVDLDLDDIDFTIHGRGNVGDTVACGGASLVRGLFRGMIETEIRKILDDTVNGIADEQTCTRCGGEFGTCSAGTCQSGICRYASNACVPRPLGVEGRLSMGSLLGDFTAAPNAAVDVIAKAGDHATVNTGVSIGMRLGGEPVSINDCIPADPTRRPGSNAVPVSPVINADRTPDDRPFHLSVGIHKRAIEQVLWSTWASGVACLDVSTEDVEQLSTSTFQIPAPSLRDITTSNSTAVMAIVPQKAPTVEFGENTVNQQGDTYEINEPLMTLIWEDLDIHVFGWAQERMVRLFSLRVDYRLPIALVPVQGQILPIIPPIESGLTNIRARRTELISEPPQRIVDIVPLLLGFAAPQLAGAIPESIDLPEFLGFRLDLQQRDIVGADKNEFLALFARLARSTQNQTIHIDTWIRDHALDFEGRTPSGLVRPKLLLEVGALSPSTDDAEFEYQWRLDGGFWSFFHTGPELVIEDPLLMAEGRHRVEVRARLKGEYGGISTQIADLEFKVDYQAPQLALEASAGVVKVVADDAVDPMPEMRFRVAGIEDWSDWTHDSVIDVRNLPHGPRVILDVQTRDSAGNVAEDSVTVPVSSAPPTQAGCATGAGPITPLLLLGLLGLRRRRKVGHQHRRLGLLLFVCAASLGCKGEVSTNATQRCFGPECQVDQACEVDNDCQAACPENTGGICENNRCQCVLACAGGCGAGEFCCIGNDTCISSMPVCTQTCEAGYEPRVVGMPNRETCEVDGGACQCVALPPIPIGVHGPYLSIDSQGGIIAIATYNRTYRDLMVGVVQADDSIDWMFVDGLPDGGVIEGDPEGPRGGTKEAGDAVGTHTAIGVDSTGRLHVAYRDDTNKTLKYARGLKVGESYDWETFVVETAGEPAYPALVVEGTNLHLIYAREGASSQLVHKTFSVMADPSSAQESIIDEAPPVAATKDYPARMGVFTQLSLIPAGGVFAVWWNGIGGRVGRARLTGTTWSDPTYLAAGSGPYASGRVDTQDREHVVFQQSRGMRYSRFNDGTFTAQVHNGLRDGDEYFTGAIGESASLSLQGEQVTIVFQDAFDRAFMTAVLNGETFDVTRAPLPVTEAQGFFTVLTSDGSIAAHYVVDRTQDPWGFVRIERL